MEKEPGKRNARRLVLQSGLHSTWTSRTNSVLLRIMSLKFRRQCPSEVAATESACLASVPDKTESMGQKAVLYCLFVQLFSIPFFFRSFFRSFFLVHVASRCWIYPAFIYRTAFRWMGGEVILVLPYGFDFSLSNFQRYFEMYPYSNFFRSLTYSSTYLRTYLEKDTGRISKFQYSGCMYHPHCGIAPGMLKSIQLAQAFPIGNLDEAFALPRPGLYCKESLKNTHLYIRDIIH